MTQQLRAGGGDAALAVLNLSGGGEAARATGRPAVEQYVLPCNRRSPERKLPRRRRARAAVPARTPTARHPTLPHFRGPDLSLALAAKVGHPAASPVPPIIERNRGTPELRRTTDSCGVPRSLSFSQNSWDGSGAAPKAILDVCGPDPQKPLLPLGGVYRRQLLSALDIQVRARPLAAPRLHLHLAERRNPASADIR